MVQWLRRQPSVHEVRGSNPSPVTRIGVVSKRVPDEIQQIETPNPRRTLELENATFEHYHRTIITLLAQLRNINE